jgi:myosin heavy subunit
MAMRTLQAGMWVWAPHKEKCFVPASLHSSITEGESGTFQTVDGEVLRLAGEQTRNLAECNPGDFDASITDLIKLSDLSESALLHMLRTRFKDDNIYTFVSSVIISVNPFTRLPIYTEGTLQSYKVNSARDMPPHIYSCASRAYDRLLLEQQSQAILISGESGAGKTEATKQILRFLAAVSSDEQSRVTGTHGDSLLEQQILKANPVMEAFGNSKTIRNNNSSRFGKLISIAFRPTGSIDSCFITQYLLEKSRVTSQQPMERNYHVFYQVLTLCCTAMHGMHSVRVAPAHNGPRTDPTHRAPPSPCSHCPRCPPWVLWYCFVDARSCWLRPPPLPRRPKRTSTA